MKQRKGVLTVEVMLLMLVVLSVSGFILSLHLSIERHNEMFCLIEDAAKDTARALYTVGRLKTSIFEDDVFYDVANFPILNNLMGVDLSNSLHNINQAALNRMMMSNLLRRAAVADSASFNAKYHLRSSVQFSFEIDQNALIINATLPYKSLTPTARFVSYDPQIRQIIPLRKARSIVEGYRDEQLAKVIITDYGIEHSHVYHTMNCMGLRYAKSQYEYRVNADLLGGTVELEGNSYQLCYFCSRKQKASEEKNGISNQ